MSIQLGNNIRIFVTYNTNTAGVVQSTGFTAENTKQLIIQQGTLSVSHGVNNNYLADTFIDSSNNLDTLGVASLDVGSVSFTTLLNSSVFDSVLWNGLVSEASYPSNLWTITGEHKILKPIRDTKKVGTFGFVIFSDSLTYVLDSCRVSSGTLDLSMDQLISMNWSCTLEQLRLISDCVIQDSGSEFNVSGNLQGTLNKLTDEYNVAASNLVKVGVYRAGGTNLLGYIASTGMTLNFTNSLNYIENNWIDRTTINKIFVDAGTYTLDGTLNFYARNSNSYSNTLNTEILATTNSAIVNPLYKLSIEILSNNLKLCDIVLDSCNLSTNQEFGTVISNTLSLKVVKSNFDTNCSIKFYT